MWETEKLNIVLKLDSLLQFLLGTDVGNREIKYCFKARFFTSIQILKVI